MEGINLRRQKKLHVYSLSNCIIWISRLKAPSPQVLRDMVLYGKRYTGEKALEVGLVDKICDESQLLECACNLANKCIGK